jgi:signal transduction histidine kinase
MPRLVTAQNVAEVAMQKLIAIAELPSRLVGVNRQQEQQRLAQLETSLEINRRIGSVLNRQKLSQEIADLIRANYGYDTVQLLLWYKQEQELALDQPGGARIPLAQAGLLGQALQRNEPVFVSDTRHSQRFPPDPRWPDTRSQVVVPIRFGGTILGLLDLHSRRVTQHSRQSLAGLQVLADQLGIAMRNAELYEEALKARDIAEKADQLKTRLLANVSHELRTPLNVIIGYAELVGEMLIESEVPEVGADVERIRGAAEHLLTIINDILDLAKIESGNVTVLAEDIDILALVTELAATMQPLVVRGANHLTVTVEPGLGALRTDRRKLRQTLYNLLGNACKFTAGGRIELSVRRDGPCVAFAVRDTGIGIPAAQIGALFEAFTQVDSSPTRRHSGTGLGLAICRRFAQMLGGSITVDSREGEGSTFTVRLPA